MSGGRTNRKGKSAPFPLKPFSKKQKQAIYWWMPGSGQGSKRMILADGAIRSGKTIAMILSFLGWSLSQFHGAEFILAGVTIGALRRNVMMPACWRPSASTMNGNGRRPVSSSGAIPIISSARTRTTPRTSSRA